jgi:MYXO-CTERM domain-containing protein
MTPRARRFLRRATSSVLLLGTLGALQTASAEQEYYDALSNQTGTCADCRLCHKGPVGNRESLDLTKPFAYYMFTNSRLGTIPDATQDSDMDGAPDLTELQQFGDPNDPMVLPGQFECPTGPTPEYGCARISPTAPSSAGASATLTALGALLFLRRRRTSR